MYKLHTLIQIKNVFLPFIHKAKKKTRIKPENNLVKSKINLHRIKPEKEAKRELTD